MNPSTTHPDYDTALLSWFRARDVIAGEDSVKAAGETYLPRLSAHTDAEYAAYKSRASFYNATSRTAAGYVGMIFRRAPFIKLTPPNPPLALEKAMTALTDDFDQRNTSLLSYAKNVVTEVVHMGRGGTLIDWNEAEQRPYASFFRAETIQNWRSERVNGRYTLTLVTLAEPAIIPTDDPFVTTTENRIRVLRLVPTSPSASGDGGTRFAEPSNPDLLPRGEGQDEGQTSSSLNSQPSTLNYVVEIWREARTDKTTEWQLVESYVPKRLGKPLSFIPFVFHGPIHSRPDIQRPPLDDVIAINLDHYRLDADYKHGIHFTALPTVWVAGFEPDSTLKIGSTSAWVTSTIGATAGFLEFTGQGLETFERAMERDERLMAILGTRLLETQKREAETAEALQLRHAGEESILSTLALSVSDSLTRALRIVSWWIPTATLEDSPDALDQSISLNTDFGIKGLTAQELQSIVAAWQAKAISTDTMLELFRKGEILPDGRSNSEELSLLTRDERTSSPLPRATGEASTKDKSQLGKGEGQTGTRSRPALSQLHVRPKSDEGGSTTNSQH
jgi:hypothetical protein